MKCIVLFSIVLFTIFSSACTQKSHQTMSPTRKARLEQLIRDWFAAFNRHDIEAIRQQYAEDAIVLDPPFDIPKKGRAEIGAHYAGLFQYIPTVQDSILSIDVVGNKAFIEFISMGTLLKPSENKQSALQTKPFAFNLFSVLSYRGEQIERDVTYYDEVQFDRQVE